MRGTQARPGRWRALALLASPAALVATAGLVCGIVSTGQAKPGAASSCTAPVGGIVAAAGAPAHKVGRFNAQQVANAAAIVGAGQSLKLDAQGVTIGVMTAIGESTLIVVDHGDAAGPDSRGLFQQRANGAWGSYADRMDPRTSATSFFQALLQVPGWRSMPVTLAAHAVQRNADPYHYAPYWSDAVQLVAAITADPAVATTLQVSAQDAPCQQAEVNPVALVGADVGTRAYNAASTQLGVPYSWGGGGPRGPSLGIAQGARTVGFDCSALVQFAYHRAAGKTLPRTAAAQRAVLPAVPITQLQAGDLLFFHHAGHVAISDGAGGFIHSPRTGKHVEHVTNWQANTYWSGGLDGAARPRM